MSHYDDLDLRQHRGLIERIVGRYIDAEVVLVSSIEEWLVANGASAGEAAHDRNRLGKSLWNSTSAPNRILLRTPLTRNAIFEYGLCLELRRFRRAHLVESALECLKHLVLHDVAHIKHNWKQDREKDCDRWAFDQLKRWA